MLYVRKDRASCPGANKADSRQLLESPARPALRKWTLIRATAITLFGFGTACSNLTAQLHTVEPSARLTPQVVQDGTAKLAGHYNPTQKLRLAIGLKPPHLEEEEQFLRDLQKKGSKEFHHYLTAKEWNERFGPSLEDEQAVADWAQSQGFTVTHRYPNRLLVDVEAPASAIEKAFGVTMNSYQFGVTSFFSNDRDPVVPAHLVSVVQSIGGLNNLHALHPMNRNVKEPAFAEYVPELAGAKGSSAAHNGSRTELKAALQKTHSNGLSPNMTNGAYDPTDLYSSEAYDTNALYNLGHCCNPLGNSGGSPIESSIAIATAGSQDWNDIQGFINQYSYLAYHAQQIYVDGTPACCDEEGTVDMEWATAMSNSFGSYLDTSTVYLYDGVDAYFSTFNDVYNRILNDNKTRIMMTGWGCAEISCYDSNDMATTHNIFNQMAGQGWTLVAPTGNQGATAGCDRTDAAQFPASDPNVIAVGGTSLSLSSGPYYNSEVGLTGSSNGCASGDGGSGGGQSAYFGVPDYQSSGTMRTVPDIALNADPYNHPQNFFFGGSLLSSGGTDFGAAEMAGFFAQENAYLVYLNGISSNVSKAAGNANYAIYDAGNTGTQIIFHYPFYDILSGCNNNDVTAANGLGYSCASTGYDEVTGWGSVNMLHLAWAINTIQTGDLAGPSVALSGPAKNQWYNNGQTKVSWVLTDNGGNYSAPTGIAGYSAAWDFNPSDVTSEATPGSGNSFYSGPWTPNFASGSLNLASTTQGCHTLYLMAWDNEGNSSPDSSTYGPLCYDSIPPTTGGSQLPTPNAFGWDKTSVQVKLGASDPGAGSTGSGVAVIYYAVDNAACSSTNLGACLVYSSPFNVTTQANHLVYFFSKDKAGNFGSRQSAATRIDETAPHTAASLSGSKNGTIYTTPVQVTLTGSDALSGIAGIVYQIDGGAQQTYTKPFTVSAIGSHKITFHSTDKAGNVEVTESVAFTIAIGPTTTKVVSSLNPSTKGKVVTFTATVTPTYGGAPTGTVIFKNGTATLGTGTLNTAHQAQFSTSTLAVGTHSITAVYAGSANFSGSTSAVLKEVVNP